MLRGKVCFVMVTAEIILMLMCLCAGYFFPLMVKHPFNSSFERVVDMAQAMLIVSISSGMAIKFHTYAYTREKKKAESASRLKSDFLATMSHEIRTPLNAIIGLSEIQMQNELPKGTYSDIEKIYNSGINLLGIINDILDISKIETGNLELVPVEYDAPSLINDVVQLNIVRVGSKNINFALHIDNSLPSVFYGDELRVKQILNNLLSNAFKYTQVGHVALKISWEKGRDGVAILTFIVSDTGIGIRKADHGKLFAKYTQLNTKANRKIEGTGLGLSITKKLVKMMHGSISAKSEFGKGSAFTVKIHQVIVDESPIGEETVESLTSFRMMDWRHSDRGNKIMRSYMPYGRILVVDDVVTNLDVARGLLLPYGLAVDCVLSGREAIELIKDESSRYDLILMDHMMPGMDGMEAAKIIRNGIGTEYARSVPIVALTANAVVGNEELFLANGFNAFISKPIDLMRLDIVLNEWVRDKQSEESLRQAEIEKRASIRDSNDVSEKNGLEGIKIDGVDIARGIEYYGLAAAYLQVLRSYARHTEELISGMENVSRETLGEYALTVHGVKGSSYGICAMDMGDMATRLEVAAKSGDFVTVSRYHKEFISSLRKLVADLRSSLDEGGEEDARDTMPRPDEALLVKMREASGNFDTTALEDAMTELERFRYEDGEELVSWLRAQIDKLEYEAIYEKLSK
ncbi:MAG: response regulator, partial [Synergistaceae bacterium]|jgi:signal transduction histidine kinase/DNA-binding response OmpR family regulator|nr:response regulator [Synergistaceae bacterium]